MFSFVQTLISNPAFVAVFKFIIATAFIWVPVILGITLWEMLLRYRRALFFSSQTYIVLEIKLPRDMFKSPLAMELFFNALYQVGGESTWYDRLWKGQTRPWFSLEIASIDGVIHFFIWTRKGMKNLIESNLYSQFPGIEVYEVPDYTTEVSYDPEKIGMWATEFDLVNSNDAYPIKTYVDYGMDKDPKEEYKIDPITPLIEFMGSLGRGHQIWLQIIIRAHKNEDVEPETGKMIDLKWKKASEKAIEDILKKAKGESKEVDGKTVPGTSRFLTDGETAVIKAIERSVSKIGFDVGIRAVYFAPKDMFSMGNVGGVVGGLRNFNSNNLNGFKLGRTAGGKYNFPWQDRKKKKSNKEKTELLDAYKKRGYFYMSPPSPHFVLNTEELATIYHFPGGVMATPTFTRIGSKKSEAPSNLPI